MWGVNMFKYILFVLINLINAKWESVIQGSTTVTSCTLAAPYLKLYLNSNMHVCESFAFWDLFSC